LIILLLVILLGLAIYLLSYIDEKVTQLPESAVPPQSEIQEIVENGEHSDPDDGLEPRNYKFEYNCQVLSINLPLFRSKYDYFSSLDKAVYYQKDTQFDLESEYYGQFLLSDQDEEVINQIIKEIGDVAKTNAADELVVALISFVQSIEYDCKKLFSYENIVDHDYQTNYPYETLYLNQGVCGDSTILLAKIIKQLGYGTAYLIFEKENHMALGLKCPEQHANYIKDGVGYCYVETTAPARIGILPQEIGESDSGNSLQIIKTSGGKTFNRIDSLADQMEIDSNEYGQYILALSTCDEISQYKQIHDKELELIEIEESLDSMESEIEPLSLDLDYLIEQYKEMGCKGTVSKSKYKKCDKEYKHLQSVQYSYEAMVIDYNNLVDEYNDLYETYTSDISRFEDLITNNSTTCSGLTFGGRPSDIPLESGE